MKVDNDAPIFMARFNNNTAGNRHVVSRYYYVIQSTALNDRIFDWIGTKYQLADTLTKSGNAMNFSTFWSIFRYEYCYSLYYVRGQLRFLFVRCKYYYIWSPEIPKIK